MGEISSFIYVRLINLTLKEQGELNSNIITSYYIMIHCRFYMAEITVGLQLHRNGIIHR